MAAARPLEADRHNDDPDAPARAELARLLLEGARRLRRKRMQGEGGWVPVEAGGRPVSERLERYVEERL